MTATFIDSHAHLTSRECVDSAEVMITEALRASVSHIVNICTDAPSLAAGLELKKRYASISNVAATTPHDVEQEGEENFALFAEAARSGSLVAVGETGLDYHYEHSPKALQKDFLLRYIQLALECELPLVIHCRDAFDDLIALLDAHYLCDRRCRSGILHCFTGNRGEAAALLERGWYLSMSGIVTFKRSSELQEIAAHMPLEKMLIETDTPYLAPVPHRGKSNSPAYLPAVAAAIARLRGVSCELVAQKTSENARKALGLVKEGV